MLTRIFLAAEYLAPKRFSSNGHD